MLKTLSNLIKLNLLYIVNILISSQIYIENITSPEIQNLLYIRNNY